MSLTDFESRGLLDLLDVELARALGRMADAANPEVELAVALTSRNVRRGHTCFPVGMRAADIWPRDAAPPGALPDATQWKDALAKSPLTQRGPLVLDGAGRLYLRRYWQLERDIGRELAVRSAVPSIVAGDSPWLHASLDRLFPGAHGSPQRRAATNALRHRVSLLCGGPGTGKTTTVAAIVALIIEGRLHDAGAAPGVMLLAPTGKSAVRLGEAVRQAKARIDAPDEVLNQIPEQATTVHRALGMQREGMHFRRNADLPLEADVIVVDEASMIDLGLMRQLLDATPRGATLLIVGDPDQLTSVEAGSVLRDLVTASAQTGWRDRVTHLTKTYRYDEGQPLGQLVAAIRSGEGAIVQALLEREDADDVAWTSSDGLQAELDRAAAHWSQVLATRDATEHFELRGRHVVLTPFRRGPTGTRRLGAAIQDRLPNPEYGMPRVTPIIIEQNSHELRVYNGDFAMLVDGQPPTATVQSDTDGFREIAAARLPQFSDAFALSVHKAQGSEFDEVLVVLPEEDAPLLTRELLYTAVSRARKRVRLVGPKQVVAAGLERRAQRYSGLVDAIGEALG
jgi:exodeoxyribonuclease V alpha subunit